MLTKQELKQKACAAIEKRKKELVGIAKEVLSHPEPGFSETRTARLVASKFDELGIQHRDSLALTGVKGRVPGGAGAGPRVAVIGELDSLIVNEHPYADTDTGAAHACGHHCQIGMMLGTLIGLMEPEVLSHLSGELVPFAVPAEEFIQVTRRLQLREEQKIEFLGGKQEL
ncbi:MAG TPA: amidohydrolase, partial [Dehalococcoidia bacterium]|nr:amidohydrolase [Dehalococcoidia bacterium]